MGISIREAEKRWDISRPTIQKKINNDELSKQDDGSLDVAEFLRVFDGSHFASGMPEL